MADDTEIRTIHIEIRGPATEFGGITVSASSSTEGDRTVEFPKMDLATGILLAGVKAFIDALRTATLAKEGAEA